MGVGPPIAPSFAALWPVVLRLLSSVDLRAGDAAPTPLSAALLLTFALPLLSDEPLGVTALWGLSVAWPFNCFFSASGAAGVAWPVVSGILCWPDFGAGAAFSAGAFCCAAGAGVSSVFMLCAETAPAPSSNIAAAVDISRRFFMDVSFGQSAIVKTYECFECQRQAIAIISMGAVVDTTTTTFLHQ
jgi:hypothetical protein